MRYGITSLYRYLLQNPTVKQITKILELRQIINQDASLKSNRTFFSKKKLIGYILALLSAVLASLTHSISKPMLGSYGSGQEINPITLAVLVYLVAGLFFTPLQKKSQPIRKINKKSILLISLIGIMEVTAMMISFFGIKDTTAINASIFINAEIIFSVTIAIILFKEKLDKKEVAPFLLILLGVVAIPVGHDLYLNGMVFTDLVFGDLLIISGGLFFATANIIAKHVSDKINAQRIAQLSSFTAAGFGLLFIINFDKSFGIGLNHLPSILVMGVFDVGVSNVFFILALRMIGAIKTILIFSTATVFGMIFASVLLAESITVFNIMSIFVVFVGLYWLRNRFSEEEQVKARKQPQKRSFSTQDACIPST